jgi:hypothetical protein
VSQRRKSGHRMSPAQNHALLDDAAEDYLHPRGFRVLAGQALSNERTRGHEEVCGERGQRLRDRVFVMCVGNC